MENFYIIKAEKKKELRDHIWAIRQYMTQSQIDPDFDRAKTKAALWACMEIMDVSFTGLNTVMNEIISNHITEGR